MPAQVVTAAEHASLHDRLAGAKADKAVMIGRRNVKQDDVWRLCVRASFVQRLAQQRAGTDAVITALLDDHLPNWLRHVGARVPGFDVERLSGLGVIPG